MVYAELKLPPPSSPMWRQVIEGRFSGEITSFALKIFLRRVKNRLERKNDPETLRSCIEELRLFLIEQKNLPHVQHDIQVLFGK